jgi:hypothetical protein
MSKAPFPIDPRLTGITLAYSSAVGLIADQVLPRTEPMNQEKFKYMEWGENEFFTLPDTLVGRKSEPTQVEFTGVERLAQTEDHGLDDIVPIVDMDNAPNSVNPENHAVTGLTELIMLGREVRVAGLVFAQATYNSGLRVVLSGTSQWSDFANSEPIDDIVAGLDAPLMRPNTMVIGREPFSKLIQHPKVNKAIHGNSGDTGIVTRQQLANLFELSNGVHVGESRLNTARKGQTTTYARVWGKHTALLWLDPLATQPGLDRVTFGWTAQYRTRFSGSIPQPKLGLRGSTLVRVGEGVKEVIVANQTGFFIEDAIA